MDSPITAFAEARERNVPNLKREETTIEIILAQAHEGNLAFFYGFFITAASVLSRHPFECALPTWASANSCKTTTVMKRAKEHTREHNWLFSTDRYM